MVWKDALLRSEKYFKKKFEYILDIEVTNPLINYNDLDKFLKKFYKNKSFFDGQFCTTPARKNPYFNLLEYKNKKFFLSKNSVRYDPSWPVNPKIKATFFFIIYLLII